MNAPLIGLLTCGNCRFGAPVKEDLKLRECRGTPPTPVALPHPQGIQIVLQRARLPSGEPGCALHALRTPTANPVIEGAAVLVR